MKETPKVNGSQEPGNAEERQDLYLLKIMATVSGAVAVAAFFYCLVAWLFIGFLGSPSRDSIFLVSYLIGYPLSAVVAWRKEHGFILPGMAVICFAVCLRGVYSISFHKELIFCCGLFGIVYTVLLTLLKLVEHRARKRTKLRPLPGGRFE